MKTTISSKGQIVLPAEIRKQDDVEPGEEFEIVRLDRGDYRLTRRRRPRKEGLVKLLLSCPSKGWFKPMQRSEWTDDVQSPKLR